MEHHENPKSSKKATTQTSKTPVIVGIVSLFALLVVVLIGFMFPTATSPKPGDVGVYDELQPLTETINMTADTCPSGSLTHSENQQCEEYTISDRVWNSFDFEGREILSISDNVIYTKRRDNNVNTVVEKIESNGNVTQIYTEANPNLLLKDFGSYFHVYGAAPVSVDVDRIEKSTGSRTEYLTDTSVTTNNLYARQLLDSDAYYFAPGGVSVIKYPSYNLAQRVSINVGSSGYGIIGMTSDGEGNMYALTAQVTNPSEGVYQTNFRVKKVNSAGNVSNFGPAYSLPFYVESAAINWAASGRVSINYCAVVACRGFYSTISTSEVVHYDINEETLPATVPITWLNSHLEVDMGGYLVTGSSLDVNTGYRNDAGVYWVAHDGKYRQVSPPSGASIASPRTTYIYNMNSKTYIHEFISDDESYLKTFQFGSEQTSSSTTTSTTSTTSSSTSTAQAANPTEALFRFYRPSTLGHLYTNRIAERNKMRNREPFRTLYNYENEKNQVFPKVLEFADSNAKPVYRAFNKQSKTHRYTINTSLYNSMNNNTAQWLGESYKFHAYATQIGDSVPFHEFYNSITGGYFYTSREGERRNVERNLPQFQYQGISFYVFPKSDS